MMMTQTKRALIFLQASLKPRTCAQVSEFVFGRRGQGQRMSSRLVSACRRGLCTRCVETFWDRWVASPLIINSVYKLTPAGHAAAARCRMELSRQKTIFEIDETAIPETADWLVGLIFGRTDEAVHLIHDKMEFDGDPRAPELLNWLKEQAKARKYFEEGLVGHSLRRPAPPV